MNAQQIKIVVVSGDDAQLSTVTDVLEDKGYQVAKYKSSEDALSALSSRPAHVIVVDQDIAGQPDALSLLGQLREMDRQLSTVMIASQGSLEVAVKAMQLGVCDYLLKPVNAERLLRSVELALARRGMFLTAPETINKIIGSRLRDIRRDSDLTTQQLADRVGVTQSQISQIETGRSAASVVTLYRISHALGMSLSKLLEGI